RQVAVLGLPADGEIARVGAASDLHAHQTYHRFRLVHLHPNLGLVARAGRRLAQTDAAASDKGETIAALAGDLDNIGRGLTHFLLVALPVSGIGGVPNLDAGHPGRAFVLDFEVQLNPPFVDHQDVATTGIALRIRGGRSRTTGAGVDHDRGLALIAGLV